MRQEVGKATCQGTVSKSGHLVAGYSSRQICCCLQASAGSQAGSGCARLSCYAGVVPPPPPPRYLMSAGQQSILLNVVMEV